VWYKFVCSLCEVYCAAIIIGSLKAPTFWLNNQHIQGSIESCAIFSSLHCNHEELPRINHAMP